MGQLRRIELVREGLLVYLANDYTTRSALIKPTDYLFHKFQDLGTIFMVGLSRKNIFQ